MDEQIYLLKILSKRLELAAEIFKDDRNMNVIEYINDAILELKDIAKAIKNLQN